MMKALCIFSALSFAFYQFLKIVHKYVRDKHIAQQTGLLDLPTLGIPRKDGKKISGTAVICGGSIAGLLAARICHDHFERVVVIEAEGWVCTEDAWPDNPSELKNKRSRLLQWDSYQTFQVWGSSCLGKLFPSLASECALSRIPIIPAEWKFFIEGREVLAPFNEYKGNLPPIVCACRPGLETLLRRLVIGRKQYPDIELVHGTVIGFERDVDNPEYLSNIHFRQGNGDKVITIPATLILDCTGPSSAGVKMIRRLDYGQPTIVGRPSLDDLFTCYDSGAYYTSFNIPVTEDMIQRFPEHAQKVGPIRFYLPDWTKDRRILLAQRVDRNIIQLLAGGWGTVDLPTNLDEFEPFSRSLNFEDPIPDWWYEFLHVLKEAEDKISIKSARLPSNTYTRFQQAENMPNNWIAVGDSVMRINPLFGQGINKALFGIASLCTMLHQVSPGRLPSWFAKSFFEVQASKIEPLWNTVKGIDYYHENATPLKGETLSTDWYLRWYIRSAMKLATKDSQAGSTMWHVMNFLAPPVDYFHPSLVPKVLWEIIRERLGA